MTSTPDRLLRRLEWHIVRRLDGRLQGAYRTVFRGSGIDFADLRGYTAEDDVRHIDWNVTARLDEPFVRQYTEDREMTAWMVIDRSASMRFGGGAGKESTAATLAISIEALRRGRARQGLRTDRARGLPGPAVHTGRQPGRRRALRQRGPAGGTASLRT